MSFTTVSQPDKLSLEGGIFPLQLHDTYALDFTLVSPNLTVEINQLSNLNFQGCLLPCEIQASLGQTLVLFAKPVAFAGNHQDLAVACVDALFQNLELKTLTLVICWEIVAERKFTRIQLAIFNLLNYYGCQPKPYFIGEGKFLGSPIFEFDNSQEDPRLKCHILVWLDTDEKTSEIEASGNYYRPLLNLLCCRSKILYVYHQAYLCNEEARKLYSQLEEKVEEFSRLKSDRKERLEQLDGWLTELPQIGLTYARYLRDIELHQITIETNVANYSYWLKELGNSSIKDIDNLDLIQEFVDKSCQIFQQQIKLNRSYLTAGKELFQQMIETIRGIVEVDAQKQQVEYEKNERDSDRKLQQTLKDNEIAERKSDRELQNTIQAVGTGIGVGVGFAGILATSYPLIEEKPWELPSPQQPVIAPHPFLIAMTASCLLGGTLGWCAWRITHQLLTTKKNSPSRQTRLPPSPSSEVVISQQSEAERSLQPSDPKDF